MPVDRPSVSAALPRFTIERELALRVDDGPQRCLPAGRRRCPHAGNGPATHGEDRSDAGRLQVVRTARSAARCRTRRPPSRGRRSLPTPPSGPGSSTTEAPRPRATGRARSSGTPVARCAAAGANTSRPWNVCDTGCRTTASDVISTAASSAAERLPRERQHPVVRPDQERAGRRAHGDRTTPGADARVDDRHVDRRRRACTTSPGRASGPPRITSWRGIECVRSITRASGAIRSITPVTHADELVGHAVVGEEDDRPAHVRDTCCWSQLVMRFRAFSRLVALEQIGTVVVRRQDLEALRLERLVVERLRRRGRVASPLPAMNSLAASTACSTSGPAVSPSIASGADSVTTASIAEPRARRRRATPCRPCWRRPARSADALRFAGTRPRRPRPARSAEVSFVALRAAGVAARAVPAEVERQRAVAGSPSCVAKSNHEV